MQKHIKNKVKKLNIFNNKIDCPVSKASTEIMLNRVCNGTVKEFPFL